MQPQRTVLHVGSGVLTLVDLPPGFQDGTWREIRLDIDPAVKPDLVGSITDMNAVGDGSVDAVYSAHNLEHVFAHEVPMALREFYRVLRSDGFVVATCPDLQALGARLQKGQLLEPLYTSEAGPIAVVDIIYGHGKAIEQGQHYMAHRYGYTAKTLQNHLAAAGFPSVGVRRRVRAYDLWALAVKGKHDRESLVARMEQYFPIKYWT